MRAALAAALLVLAMPAQAQLVSVPAQADVRSATLTLDASGNATWDFTNAGTVPPFGGLPDVTHIPQAIDTQNPIICNYTARTVALVSIHCWRTNLTGLLSSLLGGTTSGGQVNLIARYHP